MPTAQRQIRNKHLESIALGALPSHPNLAFPSGNPAEPQQHNQQQQLQQSLQQPTQKYGTVITQKCDKAVDSDYLQPAAQFAVPSG